jgi:four helix bundle protein
MRNRGYQDLDVWDYSMGLVVATYKWTQDFPRTEQYSLTSQLRRAAVSIPCNIAEGQGRAQPGEFLNSLSVAQGSLNELETLFILSEKLLFLSADPTREALERCGRTGRMLSGLRGSIAKAKALDTKRRP